MFWLRSISSCAVLTDALWGVYMLYSSSEFNGSYYETLHTKRTFQDNAHRKYHYLDEYYKYREN